MSALSLAGADAKKIAFGQHTTVAASDDAIDTGLATVEGVVVSMNDDPVDGAMHVTGLPSATAGAINIKTWKSTDADATLIAATTFGRVINWFAWGT